MKVFNMAHTRGEVVLRMKRRFKISPKINHVSTKEAHSTYKMARTLMIASQGDKNGLRTIFNSCPHAATILVAAATASG